MNEQDPHPVPAAGQNPPPIPPKLGEDPADNEPIHHPAQALESMLRQPRRLVRQLGATGSGRLIVQIVLLGVACAAAYGVVVGTFSGGRQLWAAPLKLGGGLLLAGLICLPSLYIFSCLSGSRARLIQLTGMVSGLILLTTLLLIGFAPVAWVFSQSTNSVWGMGLLHLLFGFVALFFGMRFLHQGFRWMETPFSNGLKIWTIIFTLVVVQMTTALRPIVGTADTLLPAEKKFFLVHWFDELQSTVPATESAQR